MQLSDIVKVRNIDIEVLKKVGIKALREIEFLRLLNRWQYDIWFTGTFEIRTDEYEAIKKFKYFFNHLNKPNETYFKDRIYCWIFVEQKSNHDRVHIHALIQGIDSTRAKDIEQEWLRLVGSAEVEPYDYTLEKTAAQYLAEKYSDKYSTGSLKTFDFCKINSDWRTHKKVYSKRLYDIPNKVAYW